MSAWPAFMSSLVDARGVATAADLGRIEALSAADRALLLGLFDAATAALAAEDAALRAAMAGPRFELMRLPPERRAPRGLARWVSEQLLVYTIWKEWIRRASVAWGESRRGDLVVYDDEWRAPRFCFEATWTAPMEQSVLLDATQLRARAKALGAEAFLLSFSFAEERDLAARHSSNAIAEGLTPVHAGTFPCELLEGTWREPGRFAVVTYHVGAAV